jgi:hypothetical protein
LAFFELEIVTAKQTRHFFVYDAIRPNGFAKTAGSYPVREKLISAKRFEPIAPLEPRRFLSSAPRKMRSV